MSADLSYLFREVAPAGTMAGMQQGISNAKTLMDLDKVGADIATSEFNLDKSRQMLPYDLQKAQAEATLKMDEASPEMLALNRRQKTANADLTETQVKDAVAKLTVSDIEQYQKSMVDYIKTGMGMAQRGASGKDIVSYMENDIRQKMFSSNNESERSNYERILRRIQNDNAIGEMRNWDSQTAFKQAQLYLENIVKMSPDYILQQLKGQQDLERQRLANEGHNKVAQINAQKDDKNASYQQEIVRLTRILANTSDPAKRKQLEDHIKYLEQKDKDRMSSIQTQQIGDIPFVKSNIRGTNPTATPEKKLTPEQRQKIIDSLKGK